MKKGILSLMENLWQSLSFSDGHHSIYRKSYRNLKSIFKGLIELRVSELDCKTHSKFTKNQLSFYILSSYTEN